MATPGRPMVRFDVEHAKQMLDVGFSVSHVARHFGISRPSLYKALNAAFHEAPTRYTDISDEELKVLVQEIKDSHPNAGEVYLMGHLRSRDVRVQRSRLRNAIHQVDPLGIERRRRRTITRRVYSVPSPNYLWHIDGTHKLIRWKFVIHAAIDGFTRLITYLHCSTNNRADTVLELFNSAVDIYGLPLRVRSDHGGENQRVWEEMINRRGGERQPVIVGSSVHNERVERLNFDINQQVVNVFKEVFIEMEAEGILNVENPTDLFCLHYVFLPRINRHLAEFRNAHNSHSISTERNRTPVQLFFENQHLLHLEMQEDEQHPGMSAQDLLRQNEHLRHVIVDGVGCPLTCQQLGELQAAVDALPFTVDGKAAYRFVGNFVADKM